MSVQRVHHTPSRVSYKPKQTEFAVFVSQQVETGRILARELEVEK